MGELSRVGAVVATALVAAVTLTACGSAATSEPVAEVVVGDPVPCPATGFDIDAAHAGPADQMVPGTPRGAVVCRYDVTAEPSPPDAAPPTPVLARSGRLSGDALTRVVDALNAAKPGNPRACSIGAPPTSVDYAQFEYDDRPPVVVLSWSSCPQMWNGTRVIVAPLTPLPLWWD